MDVGQAPVWLQAVVLGLIQGLTEFLPVSSSGHLVLIPLLTNWQHLGKEFDVALHFGTLVAIVVYFQEDVAGLFDGLFGLLRRVPSRNWVDLSVAERLTFHVAIASLPAGAVGFFCKDFLEKHFDSMGSIALFLALFGLLMGVAERAGSHRYDNLDDVTVKGALLLGCAQAVALMPGVSRSGATISMALLLGLRRDQAARFSFLMALPVTAAACLLKGYKIIRIADNQVLWPCAIGIVAAGVSGWLCIRFLLGYVRSRTFTPFILYRLALAGFLVAWMLTHASW